MSICIELLENYTKFLINLSMVLWADLYFVEKWVNWGQNSISTQACLNTICKLAPKLFLIPFGHDKMWNSENRHLGFGEFVNYCKDLSKLLYIKNCARMLFIVFYFIYIQYIWYIKYRIPLMVKFSPFINNFLVQKPIFHAISCILHLHKLQRGWISSSHREANKAEVRKNA